MFESARLEHSIPFVECFVFLCFEFGAHVTIITTSQGKYVLVVDEVKRVKAVVTYRISPYGWLEEQLLMKCVSSISPKEKYKKL